MHNIKYIWNNDKTTFKKLTVSISSANLRNRCASVHAVVWAMPRTNALNLMLTGDTRKIFVSNISIIIIKF